MEIKNVSVNLTSYPELFTTRNKEVTMTTVLVSTCECFSEEILALWVPRMGP